MNYVKLEYDNSADMEQSMYKSYCLHAGHSNKQKR